MNKEKKFQVDEHEYAKNEIINSAPKEVFETYKNLVTKLKKIGILSPRQRVDFLTFCLGIELQNIYSNVLVGDIREGKYYQIVCNTVENLLKYSFNDTLPITWALSSVMKEISEESLRYNRHLENLK